MTPEEHIAKFKERFSHTQITSHRFWAELYHMFKQAIKEEREACASIAEKGAFDYIAQAIRTRK